LTITLFRGALSSPLALAALVTLANAVKPVTVDDAAYLTYARHMAGDPSNPYGFSMFWWARPEPAMDVLCPPVLPYWLAIGMKLFGEVPFLLKLWLFPFIYLLAWSLRSLLVIFARGVNPLVLPLLVLSPAVMPTVNLMLDVPALALGLGSIVAFIRGVNSSRPALGVCAGILAAIAIQTKYTAFVAPAVIAWYGLTHPRFALPAVAALVLCVRLLTEWEWAMTVKYGASHFWHHANGFAGAPPTSAARVTAIIEDKSELIPPLIGQLGGLAVGDGLLAASALRALRPWLGHVSVLWCLGFALLALLPRHWTQITPEIGLSNIYWQIGGWVWISACTGCILLLAFRVRKGLGVRLNSVTWFLLGWFAIEVIAAVALTPFPAARRVLGVSLVLGLVAARASSRVQRIRCHGGPPAWLFGVGIGAGMIFAAIDMLDAFPEKACAIRSAELTVERPAGSTVWYIGHWGFQYYCETNGMKPFIPGQTIASLGDYVVLPVYPDETGFYRPYAGFAISEPALQAALVAEIVWHDWLSAQTIPNFYGGGEPISGRDAARLRVRIYRLHAYWGMGR
jgi:hypothetical protein